MGAGYRLDVNKRIMGDSIADMINHLDSRNEPSVVVNFGRSNSLKTFFTTLGVAQSNVPLRADNYHGVKDREWRVSTLWPFACNLAAIKYECKNEEVKIMLLLNEKRFGFEECENGVCKFDDLKKRYKDFLSPDNNKIVKEMCQKTEDEKLTGNAIKTPNFSFLVIISFIVTILFLN